MIQDLTFKCLRTEMHKEKCTEGKKGIDFSPEHTCWYLCPNAPTRLERPKFITVFQWRNFCFWVVYLIFYGFTLNLTTWSLISGSSVWKKAHNKAKVKKYSTYPAMSCKFLKETRTFSWWLQKEKPSDEKFLTNISIFLYRPQLWTMSYCLKRM